MEAIAKVSSIFIYPIKSCRAISVSHATLTATGFRWDRNWLVVNDKGRAYTQRVEPKLALVQVELPLEAFSDTWEPSSNSYMASETRPVDPDYARGHNVMFADLFPYMLISQGSLDALNKLLKEPVPINRFRPNILVNGCEPFSEDLWTEVRINNSMFQSVRLCSRCKIPTIDQDTAIQGSEPNKTLMEIRSDKVLRPNKKQQGKIYFGQNLVWKDDNSEGGNIVNVGDPVFILKQVPSAADAVV
ncbi:uncharacterized protein [Euphorbia lathyris]|uniref:uncharacterized protein isoform X2 n=1 Tax=Euphorbia lathyris TaxID=212925 RepID=UPI00331367E5